MREASMEAEVTQVHLAEEAIKNGSVVETVSGVINTTSFLAKDYLDECIQHLESDRKLDWEGLLAFLCTTRDRVQMASMANALNEIVGFGMVDAATSKVHAGIRAVRLQTAKAVLGQSDLGQMERLLTEIPVTADALFGGGLPNVIVQEAKRAKDWDKFKAAGHAGLKKITAISSRAEGQSSSRPPRKRGGSCFRRPDSTWRKDSSRRWKDQRSGSSPQKPFRSGGGRPFRGGGRGDRGSSTIWKPSGSSKGKGRGFRS